MQYPAPNRPPAAKSIVAIIDEAKARYAAGAAARPFASLEPNREGTWLDELRKVASSEGDYRGMAMTRDSLLEIVDDPKVSTRARTRSMRRLPTCRFSRGAAAAERDAKLARAGDRFSTARPRS